MSLVIWNEMTRSELGSLLRGGIVVLPTGATEQHGPHLPTGHDTFMVGAIARQAGTLAATRTETPIILAPTVPFGSSDHHLPFGATLSLRTETYRAVVQDLVRSMIAGGARRVMLLNGHGGNTEVNELVARDLALRHDVTIAAAPYWEIAAEALAALPACEGLRLPGHAGAFETATMLALRHDLVRTPLPTRESDPSTAGTVAGLRIERAGAWQAFDGYTDSPADATAGFGSEALEAVIGAVTGALLAFDRATAPV
jgi:creatinine amidohydrolase